jgi:predicted RNA-binding Zn-ribbon protein involved in translation (DUF1610 family)
MARIKKGNAFVCPHCHKKQKRYEMVGFARGQMNMRTWKLEKVEMDDDSPSRMCLSCGEEIEMRNVLV